MPAWLRCALPVEGVVVDGVVVGVVVVEVDGVVVVVVEPDAALAIAAPPPAITPTAPNVTSAIRNRFMVPLTSSRMDWHLARSGPVPVNDRVSCASGSPVKTLPSRRTGRRNRGAKSAQLIRGTRVGCTRRSNRCKPLPQTGRQRPSFPGPRGRVATHRSALEPVLARRPRVESPLRDVGLSRSARGESQRPVS